jgi:hypothetical protein
MKPFPFLHSVCINEPRPSSLSWDLEPSGTHPTCLRACTEGKDQNQPEEHPLVFPKSPEKPDQRCDKGSHQTLEGKGQEIGKAQPHDHERGGIFADPPEAGFVSLLDGFFYNLPCILSMVISNLPLFTFPNQA